MRYKLTVLIVFLISANPVLCWYNTLENIQSEISKIKTMKATFTQKKYLIDILDKPLVSNGNFVYKLDDSATHLRWEYTHPKQIQSVLLISGANISHYIKTNDDFVRSYATNVEVMRIVVEEIRTWLSGRLNTANFTASKDRKNDSLVILTPVNKDLKSMISFITIDLNTKPGILKSITIYENEKSYTVLSFSDIIKDAKIDNTRFTTP
ncbi:MAG: outer membrane lipoprotein carrier protein LolA [Spirochaetes bacterium]|jgi:outer membrane lipoprotein-sorting protein|nr:outer membrane lipoprotein carrier protein LolA [Spirochaetota bacterium]